jgi:hypothetical protein
MTYIYTNNDTGEVYKVYANSETEAFIQVIEHLLTEDGSQSLIEDALNIRVIDINQLKTL